MNCFEYESGRIFSNNFSTVCGHPVLAFDACGPQRASRANRFGESVDILILGCDDICEDDEEHSHEGADECSGKEDFWMPE